MLSSLGMDNSPARYGALTAAQSSLTWQRARAARLRHATSCLPLHPPPSTLHFPPPPPISRSHSSPLFLSSLVSLSPLLSLFFPHFHPVPSCLQYRTRLARRIRRAYSSLSLLLLLPHAPAPSSPLPPHPFPPSPLFPSSRVSNARLAARNPSLHFLISSFLTRHRSAHCAHPLAFRCRSLLSKLWLRLRRSLLFSLAALASRLPSEK